MGRHRMRLGEVERDLLHFPSPLDSVASDVVVNMLRNLSSADITASSCIVRMNLDSSVPGFYKKRGFMHVKSHRLELALAFPRSVY